MARHCYVVTEPSDTEGFIKAVQSTQPSRNPVKITGVQDGDELAVRRGTATFKTFECILARIFYGPASGALYIPQDDREIGFEEKDGQIWLSVWTDE